MLELITQIPGTDKRVKTVEVKEGKYIICVQHDASRLANPHPWEVEEDGWRSFRIESANRLSDAYDIHDRCVGYEFRHMMQ